MALRGGVTIGPKGIVSVVYKFDGPSLLYESLRDKFEIYEKWKKNGSKLENIGNFGINDNTSEKQTNKGAEKKGSDLQTDFSEDVPF